MSVAPSVAEVLREHVTLEIEGIDRMYLNAYVPKLQHELGVVSFFRFHQGYTFASSALMEPITRRFITAIERLCRDRAIPLITFQKGQRKDEVAARYRAGFQEEEGVVFVGKAQEKATVFRTERRYHPETGRPYAWIVRTTALVNQYYFYWVDRDFGPFFLKFCSDFPYTAKLCINGHEYLKQQLTQEGIAFEALDNGLRSTGYAPVPTPPGRSSSATSWGRSRSTPCSASGWPSCPTHSVRRIDRPATDTTSRSFRQSSP